MKIGFRSWKLDESEGGFLLRPVALEEMPPWNLKGVNQCIEGNPNSSENYGKPSYPIPNVNSCGFYCHYNLLHGDWAKIVALGPLVWGAVMCWGRMAGKKKEGIFRGEYAQILGVVEPSAGAFPLPVAPLPPKELVSRLWMLAIQKQSASEFSRYFSFLQSQIPESKSHSSKFVLALYQKAQEQGRLVEEQLAELESAGAEYRLKITDWGAKQLGRFKAQMPFPVFQTPEQLVTYANKFGTTGHLTSAAEKE